MVLWKRTNSAVRGATQGVRALFFVGAAGLVVFAARGGTVATILQTLGASFLVAASSATCGALLGFLLGLPRTVDEPQPAPAVDARGRAHTRIRPNTNLEQISDWLTKILIGVGLAEATTIGGTVWEMAQRVSLALGGGAGMEVACLGLVVYFAAVGFFYGFLWTRLELGGAMREADSRVPEQLVAALYEAEAQAATPEARVRAQQARHDAENLLADSDTPTHADLEAAIEELGELRRSQRASPERTLRMEGLLARIRAFAPRLSLRPQDVMALHRRGTEASRVAALGLLQSMWFDECLPLVLDSITQSRSAFEQYHALRVADQIATHLDPQSRTQLEAALRAQESVYLIAENPSRFQLKEHILHRMGTVSPESTMAKSDAAA